MIRRCFKKFNILFSEREKRKFVFLFVLMFFGGILEMLSVSLIVPFVAMLLPEGTGESTVQALLKTFGIELSENFLTAALVVLIFLYIFKNVYLSFEYRIQSRFINACKTRIRGRLLASYLNQSYEYFLNVDSGYVIDVINLDVDWAFTVLGQLLGMFIEVFVVAIIGVTLFLIDSSMTIMLVLLLLAEVSLISVLLEPLVREKYHEYSDNQAIANNWVLQSIRGIKEIMVTGKKKYFLNQFEKYSQIASKAQVDASFLSSLPRNMIEALTVSGVLIYILASVKSGHQLNSLIPQMSAFVVAAIRLIPSFNRISSAKTQIAYGEKGLDTVLSKLQMTSAAETGVLDAEISFDRNCAMEGVTYAYPGTDKPVLEAVDMEIPVGSFVGIIGPSGEGKTTAVDLILGLLHPRNGSILSDGQNIQNGLNQWLGHIGYIPQNIFLMDTSIRENVAFGIPEDEIDDAKVENALRAAQLWEFVQSLPEGVQTSTGEAGVRLSGGQRQRIGIARALYRDPELLIMDEATSSLDSKTEADVMEAIEALHGKKTLLVIAHRTSTLEKCDIRYRVEGTKIIREL